VRDAAFVTAWSSSRHRLHRLVCAKATRTDLGYAK
jgi:hypothetical protein